MDENRNFEPASGLPDNVEFGVVKLQTGSIHFPCCKSKTLLDLTYTDGPGLNILFKLSSDSCARPWAYIF